MQERIENLMRDASTVLRAKKEQDLERILVNAEAKVNLINTPINAFNLINPSDDYEITLTIPNDLYSGIAQNLSQAREQLTKLLNEVNQDNRSHISNVKITGDLSADPDWRENSGLLVSGARSYSQSEAEDLWGDGLRVFISHTHHIKKEVTLLSKTLGNCGMTTFVSHKDIVPTREWQREIEKALSTMDLFLAILTEEFKSSNWCGQETGIAFARGIYIMPIRLQAINGIDPYGFIGKNQALSCSWDEMPYEIVKILSNDPNMFAKTFTGYINKVSTSKSYNQSVSLSEYLPIFQTLNIEQADALAKAFNENDQAYTSVAFKSQIIANGRSNIAEHLTRLTGRQYVLQARNNDPEAYYLFRPNS